MPRFRYRFMGRVNGRLVWQSGRLPNDSRVEEVTCPARWFYSQMVRPTYA